jgi:hypothetical protein
MAEVARGSLSLVSPLFFIIQTLSFDDTDHVKTEQFKLNGRSSNYRKETFEDANLHNLLKNNVNADAFVLYIRLKFNGKLKNLLVSA